METYVKKRKSRFCKAFCLGEGSLLEKIYMEKGLIVYKGNNDYEVFTKETKDQGERAKAGDYVKIGQEGEIYPNRREYFLKNHNKINFDKSGELFEQKKSVVWVAFQEDFEMPIQELPKELRFLTEQKMLKINTGNEACYYEADIWGAHCQARRDAAIVMHRIDHNDEGKITDIGFQFVERDIFENSYEKYVNQSL